MSTPEQLLAQLQQLQQAQQTQSGIVVELRYDEKEACWMHRVLWANNSQSWEDYVQTYEEPWNDGEPDTTVIFPRYMVTAGKFGPYFTTNK